MDKAELERRIAGFDSWHYRFDFGDGVVTPVRDEKLLNRHEQRYRYFFERLLEVTGGTLEGRRVLDLACNAGFWSLKAVEAGADFVLGVDGRQMHVDQANLVFEAKGVEPSRYRFALGNIFEYPFDADYDVALCLGLMYHVAKPLELFEIMSKAGAEIIVLDTSVSLAPGSSFEVRHDPVEHSKSSVDYSLVLVPTRRAVAELASEFGYRAVPLALNMTDMTGVRGYEAHRRVAFICAKKTSIDMLPVELPPLVARRGLLGTASRLAARARSAGSRLSFFRRTRS